MTSHSDSEEYQIKTTCLLDRFVKAAAVEFHIARVYISIEAIDLFRWNIHMLDQLLMKPNAVRLRATRR